MKSMDISILKPYHGYQSSFIPFSSGHYLYLASWDRTPTEFSSFSNVWVITPENRRILFADPPDSSRVVCIYHEFHEIFGATISLDWPSNNQLHVEVNTETSDHKVDMDLSLYETFASRLLVRIGGGPPNSFMTSKPMIWLSNLLVNLLATKGGMRMVGRTETGQLFYNGAAERLMLIGNGSAAINGDDIGNVSEPTWPIEFGDSIPSIQPVLKLGTLHIPYEKGMEKDGV
jgi:hypothetical protein